MAQRKTLLLAATAMVSVGLPAQAAAQSVEGPASSGRFPGLLHNSPDILPDRTGLESSSTSLNIGTFTITPRPITATVNNLRKLFGASDPVLTYVVEEMVLVNGDTLFGVLSRDLGEARGSTPSRQPGPLLIML